VNQTLILNLARRRLTSVPRLVLLGLPVFTVLPAAGYNHSLEPIMPLASYLGVVFAAGAIGQDVSAGTLQLLLARPVTRPEYVVNRWLGASLLATAWQTMMLLFGVLVLLSGHHDVDAVALLRAIGEGAARAFGAAAVVVMFSSLVGGLADIGLLIGIAAATQFGTMASQFAGWSYVGIALQKIQESLMPELPLGWIGQGERPPWETLATWGFVVALALFVAIVRMNRKELSYAGTSS